MKYYKIIFKKIIIYLLLILVFIATSFHSLSLICLYICSFYAICSTISLFFWISEIVTSILYFISYTSVRLCGKKQNSLFFQIVRRVRLMQHRTQTSFRLDRSYQVQRFVFNFVRIEYNAQYQSRLTDIHLNTSLQ